MAALAGPFSASGFVSSNAFRDASRYFPTPLQQFQFFDKYSRFDYALGRRETWVETVDRAVSFLHELAGDRLDSHTYERLRLGILEMKVMPSMRLLAMAGPAARRSHITTYNCSYLPVDSVWSFPEALDISMSSCGVGYSVERQYVEKLPRVLTQRPVNYRRKVVIPDSQEGWAYALRVGLEEWFDGYDVDFDYSEIRPAGAVLKIKGGRASGPEPLREMLDFFRARILARQGDYLRPLDAHDLMCMVGNAAVSGGVRRTAMISLFDLDDGEMRNCKEPGFEQGNAQRWNANNSAVIPERGIDETRFLKLMNEMVQSGNGEPGIFSRQAVANTLPERRHRIPDFGTNPCGEIVLRPYQFCNLSIAVCRKEDDWYTLKEKVELATIIGTIQSMATNFPGLRPIWKHNCEEERLLGVSLSGQLDSPVAQKSFNQEWLRRAAVETNADYAAQLGINRSASITCVKPDGNSSQLLDSASGLHARWSPYYIRNVRVGAHTPMYQALKANSVPLNPENGQTADDARTWVVSFPTKSPHGAITRNDRSAVQQCEYWLQNKMCWTEHNPSVTITYKPNEVLDLIRWVWDHREQVGGMAFLPSFDAQYDQLPYIEVPREEYERLHAAFPQIDFSLLCDYETSDMTEAAQNVACSAGGCEMK